jgi:hypothetical protein
MRILFSFLEIVLWFLLEVLFAASRGELNIDDEGGSRKQPVLDTPEETREFMDCAKCGKPNQVEHVFCKGCGALLGPARA